MDARTQNLDELLNEAVQQYGFEAGTLLDPVAVEALRPERALLGDLERRIMAAVLTTALKDARLKWPKGRIHQSDIDGARAWLRGEPGFTARECCEVLGIDYPRMLRKLEEIWKAKA